MSPAGIAGSWCSMMLCFFFKHAVYPLISNSLDFEVKSNEPPMPKQEFGKGNLQKNSLPLRSMFICSSSMILLFLQRFHRFDVFLPSSFAEEKVPERVEALRNAQANGRWLTDLDMFFQPEIRRNKIYRLER